MKRREFINTAVAATALSALGQAQNAAFPSAPTFFSFSPTILATAT